MTDGQTVGAQQCVIEDCSPFCVPPRWLGTERQDGEHDYECPRLAQLRAEGEVSP